MFPSINTQKNDRNSPPFFCEIPFSPFDAQSLVSSTPINLLGLISPYVNPPSSGFQVHYSNDFAFPEHHRPSLPSPPFSLLALCFLPSPDFTVHLSPGLRPPPWMRDNTAIPLPPPNHHTLPLMVSASKKSFPRGGCSSVRSLQSFIDAPP